VNFIAVQSPSPRKISLKSNNGLLSYRQNDFQHGGVHLEFLKFSYLVAFVTATEFQICICVPNFIKIGWFLSRVSTLTLDIDTANPSVCPSVRNVPVSDENGLTHRHSFFTIQF